MKPGVRQVSIYRTYHQPKWLPKPTMTATTIKTTVGLLIFTPFGAISGLKTVNWAACENKINSGSGLLAGASVSGSLS
ncbi:hypothetical protein PEC311524_20850 [Pectobacterium carotovorum subsp. carotovorum]|nr:hypothetical protein PEC311524_20850 [Pectobacterium carotovorum subsp. carotovorum]